MYQIWLHLCSQWMIKVGAGRQNVTLSPTKEPKGNNIIMESGIIFLISQRKQNPKDFRSG